MNKKAQQVLFVVIFSIVYLSLGLMFGDTGKIVSGLIGTFAVGWLVMDVAKAVIKE